MNEEFETAIHKCERILSQALGCKVQLMEPPSIEDRRGSCDGPVYGGDLKWYRYGSENILTLKFMCAKDLGKEFHWAKD